MVCSCPFNSSCPRNGIDLAWCDSLVILYLQVMPLSNSPTCASPVLSHCCRALNSSSSIIDFLRSILRTIASRMTTISHLSSKSVDRVSFKLSNVATFRLDFPIESGIVLSATAMIPTSAPKNAASKCVSTNRLLTFVPIKSDSNRTFAGCPH